MSGGAFFVDTSALAKRYISEIGSSWVRQWIEPTADYIIVIAEIALVEMQVLIQRRQREGLFAPDTALALYNDFLIHAKHQYLRVAIEDNVLNITGQLAERYPLRTLDAIQLASAVYGSRVLSEQLIFISADHRLLSIASAEGFETDNPLLHL